MTENMMGFKRAHQSRLITVPRYASIRNVIIYMTIGAATYGAFKSNVNTM